MIDWINLLFNSFWLIGLAILLAAFSYHYWLADIEGSGLREQLRQNSFQKFYWISFIFTGIGLAGTSHRWWETAVWVFLTVFSAINAYKSR